MDALNRVWEQSVKRIDALSTRERAMVFAAMLAILFLVWDQGINVPLQVRHATLLEELSQAQRQEADAQRDIAAVLTRARIDPNVEINTRLQGLLHEQQALESRKAAFRETLLTPNQMLDLLRGVLAGHERLQFVELHTYPARPLFEPATESRTAQPGTPIFRHDMTVEFEGGYFDVLDYLRALEGKPLFWDSIAYEVRTYPNARIKLRVYTLSLDREWLGV